MGDWPVAFDSMIDHAKSGPGSFNIQVIGGDFGTGSTLLTKPNMKDAVKEVRGSIPTSPTLDDDTPLGEMQHIIADSLRFESIESRNSLERLRLLQQEKLFGRCAYFRSLADTLDV